MITLPTIKHYDSYLESYLSGRMVDLRLAFSKFPVNYFVFFDKCEDMFSARVFFLRNASLQVPYSPLSSYSDIDFFRLHSFVSELYRGGYECVVL